MDNYFQRPEVSNSDLSKLKKVLAGQPIESFEEGLKEAFKFGNLVDAMLTDPGKVNYYSLKVNNEEYTEEEFFRAKKMCDNFFANNLCKMLHSKCEGQKTLTKTLQISHNGVEFELPARCRYDLYSKEIGMAGEIKTTAATTLNAFKASIPFLDYDRARAWYMDISGIENELFIGLSKKNYQVFVVPVKKGDEIYLAGKAKYSELAYEYYKIMQSIK